MRWRSSSLFAIAVLLLIACHRTVLADAPAGDGESPPQRPVASATQQRIDRLIAELGADDYYTREHAQRQLRELKFAAYDALLEAAYHPDLEIAARARRLLSAMQIEWVRPGDSPAIRELLRDYELLSTDKRRERMSGLAEMATEEAALVLARLARHERSAPLSKTAALLIIQSLEGTRSPSPEVIAALRKRIAPARRVATSWLDAWLEHRNDRAALAEQFVQWLEREQALLERGSTETTPRLVGQLIRMQIQWLRESGNDRAAVALTRSLLDLELGRRDDLQTLLEWLIEQESWATVGEIRRRFGEKIQTDSELLYLVAEALRKQGNKQEAEQMADRAYQLRSGIPGQAEQRAELAMWLWQRGSIDWAIREFDDALEQGAPMFGQQYAELLHDQGRHLRAAEVLETMLDKFEQQIAPQARATVLLQPFQGRVHYFRACHHLKQGELTKHKQQLDRALEKDPQELDALIARYRLADQSDDYRQRTLEMIRRAAEQLEREIQQSPEDAAGYNQYAWLIGNTEGDLDRALKYSRRSLELRPNTGGYLDTLAHVHYARGEYAEAVKQQERAAALEPHSKLITDKLTVFRNALEKQRADDQP